MKKYQLTFSLLVLTILAYSQDGDFHLGARNTSLGGASLTLGDAWSVFNNPGGIGWVDKSQSFISYQNRYNLTDFKVIGGGYVHTSTRGNAALSVYRFGDELYSQQKVSFTAGNKLQLVSLGFSVSYLQYQIESIGTKGKVLFEFGGIVELIPEFVLAASIFNMTQAELTDNQSIPTVLRMGFSYRPSTGLMLNVDVDKDLEFDTIVKIGIEYEIIESVVIRSGLNTNPNKAAFGFGLKPGRWNIDYAFSNQAPLGSIHEVSLGFFLVEK